MPAKKKVAKKVNQKKVSSKKENKWLMLGLAALGLVVVGGLAVKLLSKGSEVYEISAPVNNFDVAFWDLSKDENFITKANIKSKVWQPLSASLGSVKKNVSGAYLTNLNNRRGIKIPMLHPLEPVSTMLHQSSLRNYDPSAKRLTSLTVNIEMQAVAPIVANREIGWMNPRVSPTPTPMPAPMNIPMTVEFYSQANSRSKRVLQAKVNKIVEIAYNQSGKYSFVIDAGSTMLTNVDLMRVYVDPATDRAWTSKHGKSSIIIKSIEIDGQSTVGSSDVDLTTITGMFGKELLREATSRDYALYAYTITTDSGDVYNVSYRSPKEATNKRIIDDKNRMIVPYTQGMKPYELDVNSLVGKRVTATGKVTSIDGISSKSLFAYYMSLEDLANGQGVQAELVAPASEAIENTEIVGGVEVNNSDL